MEDLCQGNKLTDLDVHPVRFYLGIAAFGYRQSHQIELCHNLILRQPAFVAQGLYVFSNIHVWPDLLHLIPSCTIFRNKETYALILISLPRIMFRNREIFRQRISDMMKRKIEMWVFSHLCGQKDRMLLNGKREMSYDDFNRLTYLACFFHAHSVSTEIWRRHYPLFTEQFAEDATGAFYICDMDKEIQKCDSWIEAFCKDAPSKAARRYLQLLALINGYTKPYQF